MGKPAEFLLKTFISPTRSSTLAVLRRRHSFLYVHRRVRKFEICKSQQGHHQTVISVSWSMRPASASTRSVSWSIRPASASTRSVSWSMRPASASTRSVSLSTLSVSFSSLISVFFVCYSQFFNANFRCVSAPLATISDDFFEIH